MQALQRLGVPCDARYYAGEHHAFHAMIWREAARRCWRETFEFLGRHVPVEGSREGLASEPTPPERAFAAAVRPGDVPSGA